MTRIRARGQLCEAWSEVNHVVQRSHRMVRAPLRPRITPHGALHSESQALPRTAHGPQALNLGWRFSALVFPPSYLSSLCGFRQVTLRCCHSPTLCETGEITTDFPMIHPGCSQPATEANEACMVPPSLCCMPGDQLSCKDVVTPGPGFPGMPTPGRCCCPA